MELKGWIEQPLEKLVSFKTGKLNSNAATTNGKYPFFTCSQETFKTDTFSFDEECVLLGGNNANGVYPLKFFSGKFNAYQRTYIIKALKDNEISNKFLYYALRLRLEQLRSISTGAATKFLTLTILNHLKVSFPKRIETQQKIAGVLSAYDDLIENNNRRIKILEEMAQKLYKEWFVDFKFPGHQNVKFIDSTLGKIPKGWEILNLGSQLISLESGRRPKGGVHGIKQGIPSVGAENINGIGNHNFSNEKFVPIEFFQNMRNGVVQDRDVAIYKDGAYIGKSSYFRDGFPHAKFCVNEHVFLLRTNGTKLTQNLLYLWLQEPDTVDKIRGTNANAAQPGINQQSLSGLELALPNPKIVAAFDQIVESLLATIVNLSKQNQTLRQTRDLLLPRLISGELSVENLEVKS